VAENRGRNQASLELVECSLIGLIKHERDIRLGEPSKRLCDCTIVSNKPTVEVAKSKEGLHSFYRTRLRPMVDDFCLFRVDLNAFSAYNKAQVLRTSNSKLTLLNVYLQACIPEPLEDLLNVLLVHELVV
jgi:hypothetical protein